MQAYLLAAGKGTRAGGPKAWLDCGGETLLERQVKFLSSLFPPDDVAVSIQQGWIERCRSLNASVRWVGVDPQAPALASLQALLQAMPLREWAFVHHVDMPVWEPGLFDLIAVNLPEPADCDAVVPLHQGMKGHPVALSARAHPALLALDPSTGRLDHWLQGAAVRALEVPYACVRENWNRGAPR
ncbi:MAG: nucleotidyltransferase family protein [Elusimicrobia bacterium]|nr:nucleotidyltransferase family protein [Elusimicrobiota bacterium]